MDRELLCSCKTNQNSKDGGAIEKILNTLSEMRACLEDIIDMVDEDEAILIEEARQNLLQAMQILKEKK